MSTNYEAIAEQLAERASALGADSSALDELVCDCAIDGDALNAVSEDEAADALAEMESGASEINNGGFMGQILFLLESGVAQGKIEEALGLAA